MTVLGHIIASNSRYASPRLKFLIHGKGNSGSDFIVEPERGLTASHRAAWAHCGLRFFSGEIVCYEHFETETNRDVLYELLQTFNTPAHLNRKSISLGRTALHFAVETGNTRAVDELMRFGADPEILDDANETPLIMAQRFAKEDEIAKELSTEIEKVITILKWTFISGIKLDLSEKYLADEILNRLCEPWMFMKNWCEVYHWRKTGKTNRNIRESLICQSKKTLQGFT
jgi:hypothetical protein